MSLSQRLLRRRAADAHSVVRLPWTRGEEHFTDHCTRCDDCVGACPERIIVRGDGGFPQLDFRAGGCTLCGACVDACKEPLFQTGRAPQQAFAFRITVSELCFPKQGIECRSCGEACEAQAIRFRFNERRMAEPQIDTDACTGCGFCIAVCPVDALQRQPISVVMEAQA